MLIHLLNRRRHRVVRWAAMDFLLQATRESKGKKKLKHILILTSRALALMALVLAVARPLSTSGFLSWGSSKVDTVILILDRSSSMEAESSDPALSKRLKSIQLTQQSISKLGGAKLVLLDSATNSPLSIASPDILDAIAQTQATDTTASIPALLTTAVEYVLDRDTGRTEIWLASDMQGNNWKPESPQWNTIRAGLGNLAEHTSLRVISLKSEPTNNLATRIKKAQRVDDALLLEIEVTRDSQQEAQQEAQQVPLTLSLNGAQSTESITLAGQTTTLNKRLPLNGKSGYGYLQLPSDSNPRDNTSYFSYGSELPVHSAVLASKGESQYYLSLAAAPPGYAKQQSTLYTPSQALPFDSLSLIIWQAPLPDGQAKAQLLDFVEKGGVVAFFPPLSGSSDGSEARSFLDTRWGIISQAASGKYFIVEDWTRNDGPLRNGDDGNPIPVSKLKAIQRREIVTEQSSLADWSNSSSLLTRAIHGKGAAYFISTLPDYSWSNLGDADVILPLVQRLLLDGNQRFGSGFNATVGSLPAAIKIDATQRQRLDSATAHDALNADFEAGVYRFGERTIATNRPQNEDSAETLDNQQLEQLLASTNYRLFEDQRDAGSSISKQLWQLFLVAMLLLMILEAALCLVKKRKTAKLAHSSQP